MWSHRPKNRWMKKAALQKNVLSCAIRQMSVEVDSAMVDFVDVSPRMVVSVATSMIPFLENDDQYACPDGFQHAEAGCAADGNGIAHCRYRYGIQSCC